MLITASAARLNKLEPPRNYPVCGRTFHASLWLPQSAKSSAGGVVADFEKPHKAEGQKQHYSRRMMPDEQRGSGAAAIIGFTRPFRLVVRDQGDSWSPSLEEIGKREYDYVKLNRLSTSFDIGLAPPLCVYVGFDGSIVIPAIPSFRSVERAVSTINQLLGELLLGGIYYESVGVDDLDTGVVLSTGYVRCFGQSRSYIGRMLSGLRFKVCGELEAIELLGTRSLTIGELHSARVRGKDILAKVSTLSVEFILHGVSSYSARDWPEALSNLWISIEQIVSSVWDSEVRRQKNDVAIRGRSEFLKDTRAWTTSTRLEVLFQRGLIDATTYNELSVARKARNDLVHNGTLPTHVDALAALTGVYRLLSLVITSFSVADTLNSFVRSYSAANPRPAELFEEGPRVEVPVEELGGLWLGPLPPLPGESEWGDREYEHLFKQQLNTAEKNTQANVPQVGAGS